MCLILDTGVNIGCWGCSPKRPKYEARNRNDDENEEGHRFSLSEKVIFYAKQNREFHQYQYS